MFDSLSSQSIWPRRWLQLAVLSLAISGVFSIILVVSRTPQLIALFPWMGELFAVSLVIHVDLSVLVWFLAMAGLLLSLLPAAKTLPYAHAASVGCVLLAVLCMALSPLTGQWQVIKSNYVPVMLNPLFFAGLGLLCVGMLISALQRLANRPKASDALALGIYGAAALMVLAAACFVASAQAIPEGISGRAFYENLFWAGGHVLQFVYMQILLVAWVVLAKENGLTPPPKGLLYFCLLVGPVVALLALYPYMAYEVMSQEHMDGFTLLMDGGLGIGAGVLGVWYGYRILAGGLAKAKTAYRSALLASFTLFILGGAFGAAINGPNVRIPAHYHGSIVAVTLALMGLAYWLLPKLGGQHVAQWRLARWQPVLYGFGQTLHITGLAISGGYGVLRKSVGDVGSGGWEVKAALGMMGGGGLLAIIGGLLFVIIMVKGFRRCGV